MSDGRGGRAVPLAPPGPGALGGADEGLDGVVGGGGWVSHLRQAELRERLKEERIVLRQVCLPCVVCFVFMVYGAALLFRNIAFYRYRGLDHYADLVAPHSLSAPPDAPGVLFVNASSGEAVPLSEALRDEFRGLPGASIVVTNESARANLTALNGTAFDLRDLAADYLWDLSDSSVAGAMNEAVATSLTYATMCLCVLPLVLHFRGRDRPYCCAMFYRLQRCLATVHILRVLTYLATAIPGSADHCQSVRWTGSHGQHGDYEIGQEHVQTVWQWFFDTYNFLHNSNCGDLLFSGHCATAITNALFAHYYARRLFPSRLAVLVAVLGGSLCCLQVFLTLCSHNHYTVDVVIASYVAPLSFLANSQLFPTDATPKAAAAPRASNGEREGGAMA